MMAKLMRYEFGRNWANFVQRHFSEERIQIAQRHLLNFLKLPDLRGKSFLDVGCGSGIHSLAALRVGAERVVSFDYDPGSVETTARLKEYAGAPVKWAVMQGSILDRTFLERLLPADIVYSWGVLHHSGEMWKALCNAAALMKAEGVLYIALYTKDVYIDPTSEYWLGVKRDYNGAGALRRWWMELVYVWRFTIFPELRAGRNPFTYIRTYEKSRGMSYWTDVKDWLGGWPMEFAGIQETKDFCREELGLELLNIKAGEANTEYLLRKKGAKNYWDAVTAGQTIEPLVGPFARRSRHAWIAGLPGHTDTCDTNDEPRRSRLMLFEDGMPVGFAHSPHAHIELYGGGRYSHWGDLVVFSSSDNTDPNRNGRTYSVCADML